MGLRRTLPGRSSIIERAALRCLATQTSRSFASLPLAIHSTRTQALWQARWRAAIVNRLNFCALETCFLCATLKGAPSARSSRAHHWRAESVKTQLKPRPLSGGGGGGSSRPRASATLERAPLRGWRASSGMVLRGAGGWMIYILHKWRHCTRALLCERSVECALPGQRGRRASSGAPRTHSSRAQNEMKHLAHRKWRRRRRTCCTQPASEPPTLTNAH